MKNCTNPEETHVYSGGEDGHIRGWNISSGEETLKWDYAQYMRKKNVEEGKPHVARCVEWGCGLLIGTENSVHRLDVANTL